MAKSKSLSELIELSSSSRRFFLSLPVKTQMSLHSVDKEINTAQELHRYANLLERHNEFINKMNSNYNVQ